ncbi:MAG: hypothetical protein IKQ39_08635 [Oscillospiraceae bacterium]|nr:hypothetical protein [Oscillospiraceae bacterium]
MKQKRAVLLLAGCLAASVLCGCSSDRDPNAPDDESSTAEITAETTTETAAQTTSDTTQTTTETTADTTAETTTDTDTAKPAAPRREDGAVSGSDDDTRLLWSERGLEAVPADSEGGYGEELAVGEEYLGWKLNGFDGTPEGGSVPEVKASFTYNGTLSQNGQIRVLPSSDAHYPNGLYMHADNIADFPYFPADTRDRGWYVIENADEVLEMLGLESAGDISGDLSVTVSIDAIDVHVSADDYDTVHVTAASKR